MLMPELDDADTNLFDNAHPLVVNHLETVFFELTADAFLLLFRDRFRQHDRT